MSLAETSIRGADLNCWFAVNGIQNGSSVFVCLDGVPSGMAEILSLASITEQASGRVWHQQDDLWGRVGLRHYPVRNGLALVESLSSRPIFPG